MKYVVDSENLTAIADAIRAKTGKSASLTLAQMPTEIESIESGSSSDTSISKLALLASGQPFALTAKDLEGAEIVVEEAFYAAFLTEVTIPSSVKEIADYAFSDGAVLKKVTIREGLTTLGHGAFAYCELLEEVNLPASLTAGNSAFQYCTSLSKVTLNEGISVIDQYMFFGCTALTEIHFPKSITHIKTNAFSNCDSMQVYDFSQHESIPTLDLYLAIPDGCEIRVPASLYSRWKASTNWSTYAANIVSV